MKVTFASRLAASDKPLLGCVVTLSPYLAVKMVARAGFDWVMIDMEHAPYTAEQASNMVHAVVGASAGRCLPLIRVPSHGVEWIKWAMDSGAAGIIVPMVETAAQMQEIITAARYPPRGARSFGPAYAAYGDIDPDATRMTYFAAASRAEIAILPMIESAAGVEQVHEILSVDGVSGVFVGPQDLRLSLGLSPGDGQEPNFVDALTKITTVAKSLNKPIGSMGMESEQVRDRAESGMQFLLCSIDAFALRSGLADDLRTARAGLKL